MSLQKFSRNNLLKFEGVKIEVSNTCEMFACVKLEKGKPMGPVESELNAIDKVEAVKEYHKEIGIKKSEKYYYYFKLQTMALNDAGYKRTKEHFFKNYKGEKLKIMLN